MQSPATGRRAEAPGGRAASPRLLACGVTGLLVLHIALAWLALVGTAIFVERLWYGLGGYFITDSSLADHVAQLQAVRRLQGMAWMATAGTFLAWVHRCHRNLGALGIAGLAYTPRWAVGAFMVPLLNLVHPVRVVRELWLGSEAARLGDAFPRRGGTPSWALAWWPLLVLSVLADPSPARLLERTEARLDLGPGMLSLAVSALAEIAAAALAIVVVRRITGSQEEYLERLRGAAREPRRDGV